MNTTTSASIEPRLSGKPGFAEPAAAVPSNLFDALILKTLSCFS
jgi:hypothetical protein